MSRRHDWGIGRGKRVGGRRSRGMDRDEQPLWTKKLVEYAPSEGSDVSSLSDLSPGTLETIDLSLESTLTKVC